MYLCGENKGADQFCGYHTADLCLCFHIYKKAGFFMSRIVYFLTRGVPFPVVCKNRKERIAAIGDAVARSDYHIVALQEVGPTV